MIDSESHECDPIDVIPGMTHGSYDCTSGSDDWEYGRFILDSTGTQIVVTARSIDPSAGTTDGMYLVDLTAERICGRLINTGAPPGCFAAATLHNGHLLFTLKTPRETGDVWHTHVDAEHQCNTAQKTSFVRTGGALSAQEL